MLNASTGLGPLLRREREREVLILPNKAVGSKGNIKHSGMTRMGDTACGQPET